MAKIKLQLSGLLLGWEGVDALNSRVFSWKPFAECLEMSNCFCYYCYYYHYYLLALVLKVKQVSIESCYFGCNWGSFSNASFALLICAIVSHVTFLSGVFLSIVTPTAFLWVLLGELLMFPP